MDDEDEYYDDSIDVEEAYSDDDEEADEELVRGKQRYVVLTQEEIVHRLSHEAADTAEVSSVPLNWALALFVHYRWDPLRLHEAWFADQHLVRAAVGLPAATTFPHEEDDEEEEDEEEEEETETTMMTCGICTEGEKPASKMASAGCAHRYCHGCWRRYVAAAVEDKGSRLGCLALRCPHPSCSRAVLRDMIEQFIVSIGDDDDVYSLHLARDYVDAHGPWMTPCPAAGCGRVIETVAASSSAAAAHDAACACGAEFCVRCGGAAHWPSTCAAAARVWTSSADAASADWVLLHTKPCPRCRRPIERASGCIYIRCAPPCGHHFCFRCLRPVAGATPEGAPCFNGHDLLRRRGARVALDRFLRYQDLWAACRRKRRLAQSEARRIREEMTVKPRGDAKRAEIVAEAWEAVAEGRRVLGNACAHGIGLRGERELFDHQHGQADAVLDRMQQEAAVEAADLDKFVGDHRACNELAALTRVTWQCIEKLAKAVEEGMILPEMKAPASS